MDRITIISVILIILGSMPLILVLIKRRMQKVFMQKAVTTTAVVTNCEKRIGLKGSVYYILSLQYTTIDGRQILNGTVGSGKKERGDRIPLMYLPDKPTRFSIDFGKRTPYAIAITILYLILVICFCVWLNNL